jgi:pentatricopeptide repeat protein
MTDRRHFPLSPGDVAYRLELITKVHGLQSAVAYFGGLSVQLKKPQCYGSLLKCYAEAKSVEEAEKLFADMQKMEMMSSYPYNVMMKLYLELGQVERVHTMYKAMEESGIKPDVFTVDTLLKVYAAAEDLNRVEELLEKSDPKMLSWHSHASVARLFMKAGLQGRALQAIEESEKRIRSKNGRVAYGFLLSMCADLGMSSEVDRIWNAYKSKVPTCNTMYMCRISVLLKMNDIDGAENAFREWESRYVHHDIRLTNLLLNGYCANGLMEKAEALVDEAIAKGRTPYANTWYKLAGGFFKDGQVSKAVDLTRKALASATSEWEPDQTNVLMSLEYFTEQKNVKAAEEIASQLRSLVPLTREVYHGLLKTYVHAGQPVSDLLDRMNKDGFEANEETNRIIAGICR